MAELNEKLKTSEDKPLETLKNALVEAVTLLRSIGVLGWGALPYAYQLVTLAALAARAPGSLETRRAALERWFWRTTYAEHYTGQTGGQIRRDIDTLADTNPDGDDLIAHGAEVRGLSSPIRQNTVRMKAHLIFLATRPNSSEARSSSRGPRRQFGRGAWPSRAAAFGVRGETEAGEPPRCPEGRGEAAPNAYHQGTSPKRTLTSTSPLELVRVRGHLDEALVTTRRPAH
ncbi:MAG: hypothetical protein IPO67_20145 [Deltaproteobacteria bacterium]|nr:hypothetical protein [Deltaproteobacteria bacterium]